MKTRIKIVSIIIALVLVATTFTGCMETTGSYADKLSTEQVANNLQHNQPTPTDITYSLQRYNLIRRAYWVNGMREKARTLPCEVEKPLGYIYFFVEGVGCIAQHTVDGQITSLRSYLTPDSEYYGSSSINDWLADVDGTYGDNHDGIFFFTVDGNYVEWNGLYHYSDIYYEIDDPVLKTVIVEGGK